MDDNQNEEVQQQEEQKPAEQNTTTADGEINISIDGNTTKKIIYSLCYLWGILFFLPLILYKNDPDAKMHANEGLLLLTLSVIGNVVFGVLTLVHGLFGIIAGVYSLLLFLFGIIGIVYVVTDKHKALPVIGAIKLIK